MANTQETSKVAQPNSKPTLEQLVKNANDKKQVSKEELAVILDYEKGINEIKVETKANIETLLKEAGMDMLKKGMTIKNEKDFHLFIDILGRNGVKINIGTELKEKILGINGGVVTTYSADKKKITIYSGGKTGSRLGYIDEKGEYKDDTTLLSFYGNNDEKDDDLGLIKDKNVIREPVKKDDIPSTSDQEIKDAKFGLDKLDNYTKIELNEIYKKSSIDGIKKLAKLHGMMNQNDVKLGLQEFGGNIDNSHIHAAVKLLKVFGEDKAKIEVYLNNGGEIKKEVKKEGLKEDEIKKHKQVILKALKGNDINLVLTEENRPSYDYMMKNFARQNAAGILIFEEEGKKFGEKLKTYITNKNNLDIKQSLLFIDPKQNPNIKLQINGKDYGTIEIVNEKFELKAKQPVVVKKEEEGENLSKQQKYSQEYLKKNRTAIKKIVGLINKLPEANKKLIKETLKNPTEDNVKKLQILLKIKDDGYFGNNTLKSLEKLVGIKVVPKQPSPAPAQTPAVAPAEVNEQTPKIKNGTFKIIDGDTEGTYTGKYYEKDGNRIAHGKGTTTWKNGDKYIGEWKDGNYCGQGTYTFKDGRKYVGEFKDGNFCGQGTFTWKDGRKYVGEFKDDKKHGQGTFTWKDGDKYIGEFKDGNFCGQGTYTFKDGRKYVGTWNNEEEFTGKEYDKEGTLICNWIDGKNEEQIAIEKQTDAINEQMKKVSATPDIFKNRPKTSIGRIDPNIGWINSNIGWINTGNDKIKNNFWKIPLTFEEAEQNKRGNGNI